MACSLIPQSSELLDQFAEQNKFGIQTSEENQKEDKYSSSNKFRGTIVDVRLQILNTSNIKLPLLHSVKVCRLSGEMPVTLR